MSIENKIQELRGELKKLCLSENYLEIFEEISKDAVLFHKFEKTIYDTERYLVYKHTDPFGKIYIGITRNNPQSRWNDGAGYESQKKFYKAIQYYGWIHFKHEIIAADLSEEEARAIEADLITKTNSDCEEYGYNTVNPNRKIWADRKLSTDPLKSVQTQESTQKLLNLDKNNEALSIRPTPLRLNQSTAAGRAIIEWVNNNPLKCKRDCVAALGYSYTLVNNYWPRTKEADKKIQIINEIQEKKENHSVFRFIADKGEPLGVAVNDAYDQYCQYCKQNNIKEKDRYSLIAFSRFVMQRIPDCVIKRKRVNRKEIRYFFKYQS